MFKSKSEDLVYICGYLVVRVSDFFEYFMDWIPCKERLPKDKLLVMAKNPHCESVSWIDGKNENGKPCWFHLKWEHADDYVTHWRCLINKDVAHLE